MSLLSSRAAVAVFLSFAFAYFLSALIRAATATLAPALTLEFALSARDLGLLAGGYFLGFSVTQLPLGAWLDRHGPRKVVLWFLGVAVVGCLGFSMATSFSGLLAARVLCGMGVSACLMAPLTGYRRWLSPATQLRANAWMLMTGSLGMVASTLPVQWLLPQVGWRPIFWGIAGLLLVAMAVIAWQVPVWRKSLPAQALEPGMVPAAAPGYAEVWRNPQFRRFAPLCFVSYGGLVAMQTLWAGPWLVQVAGYSALEAAAGLFWINATMLCTFWCWGFASPWLARRGVGVDTMIAWVLPGSFIVLAIILIAGDEAGPGAWALFCMFSSVATLAQPAVALACGPAVAGRALSATNLVVFLGVFCVQWAIGLGVDAFTAAGMAIPTAYRASLGIFLLCTLVAYGYFLAAKSHNAPQQFTP